MVFASDECGCRLEQKKKVHKQNDTTISRGYPIHLGIRIFVEKKPIFSKDKDILSIILRIKDKSLHLEDLGINKNNMDEIASV